MMPRMTPRRFLVAGVAVVGMLAAGCASGAGDEPTVTESHDADQPGHGSGHGEMHEPDATPADELQGAEVRTGEFEVLDTAPPKSNEVAGQVWVAENEDGTTVTVRMTGVEPGEEYMLHLHEQSCGNDAGGEHFKFDPEGSDEPPNEVHLGFTAKGNGEGEATVTNDQQVGRGATSIVMHPVMAMDNRIACADY